MSHSFWTRGERSSLKARAAVKVTSDEGEEEKSRCRLHVLVSDEAEQNGWRGLE